jgi:hypothetical protein
MSAMSVSTQDDLARQFAEPQKAYSPVPIWWWSGEPLERTRLRWQMEQLIAGGVYNVVILNLAPTSPLYGADPDQPAFMSEAWWEIFLGVCEDAQTLGMRIWFYDQIGFSGANLQGEIVRANPAFAGQALASAVVEGHGVLTLTCPSEGEPLAAAYIPLDENGRPTGNPITVTLNGRTVHVDTTGNKRLRLMYAIRRGFDYFSAEACDVLLNTVHRSFEGRARQYFGSVIVGSFQDELPTIPSWGSGFFEAFQRIKGYDLRPKMVALWEGESAVDELVRLDYHQVRATLTEEAFFRPFFEWHQAHGLICGFDQQGPARAGDPIGGVRLYADYLQTHRWYGAPGSDHHGDAKIHSSLAHLYDRPRVWIESFHSSGWGGTLEETFDWLLPWLRTGATLYDPHAVYYSTHGGWWEWAPPSTCWRQPYWRHYHIYANAISRLCFLLSQGNHVCDIGVLYPTVTVQAGLAVDDTLPAAKQADAAYKTLTGSMMFLQVQSGILDQDRRDFDVLDDASIQRGTVEDGALHIGAEAFRALILPACKVLDAETVAKLIHFAQGGGLLIAVGCLPELVNSDATLLESLRELFVSGTAVFVQKASDVTDVLSRLPRTIEAPVPTLHRRIDGKDVLFVPAAYPHATHSEETGMWAWLKAEYDFDPARYQRPMTVRTRGLAGTPQLWDAISGERHTVTHTQRGDETEITLPFDTAPVSLLVWSELPLTAPTANKGSSTALLDLANVWECSLEQTLDNRYGDLTMPRFEGAPPVQTWHFDHCLEQAEKTTPWTNNVQWTPVVATFGVYGWASQVQPAAALPAPLTDINPTLGGDGWQPIVYSLQRGIYKDEVHVMALGPKGHVPEEFLAFGHAKAGDGVQFRTTAWAENAQSIHLALAAPTGKTVWVNGALVGEKLPGYLSLIPVELRAGRNLIEWRLTAEQDGPLRAYWTLVTDPAAFARPERMIPSDAPRKDSRLSYSLDVNIPFEPADCTLQVSANSPCRVIVNGIEAGRQGGFDPYASLARVQPYFVTSMRAGVNSVVIEVQDIGSAEVWMGNESVQAMNGHAAVMVDGLVTGQQGETLSIISSSHWCLQRDDGEKQSVVLFRPQWFDPAWSHLWRRPHPLPEAAWLDGTSSCNAVLPLVPDAGVNKEQAEWFRWKLPPGAVEMHLNVAGSARVWVDEIELPLEGDTVRFPASNLVDRVAYLRVMPHRGRTGGGIFLNPITYTIGDGRIRLGDWCEHGLHAYSGGVRYKTTFTLNEHLGVPFTLDLGRVRGTAEVWVNGQLVGARIGSPYSFDVTQNVQAGSNTVEVLVLNTLAPYLHAVSPTHYVRPGQTVSGLIGPVRLFGSTGC